MLPEYKSEKFDSGPVRLHIKGIPDQMGSKNELNFLWEEDGDVITSIRNGLTGEMLDVQVIGGEVAKELRKMMINLYNLQHPDNPLPIPLFDSELDDDLLTPKG